MIVIDNFIKDSSLIEDMQDVSSDFWTIGWRWWAGWMNGCSSTTLRHRLIEYIWKDNAQLWSKKWEGNSDIAGFEHWCGIFDDVDYRYKIEEKLAPPNNLGSHLYALNHHIDSDEYLHMQGTNKTPFMGTIYYPHKSIDECEGGYLRIYDSHKRYGQYVEEETKIKEPYELIKPKFNRLIVFDASKLHAVEEVTKGIRYAVAINLWKERLSDGQLESCLEVIE